MQQRTEKHDDRAGTASGLEIHLVQRKLGRPYQLKIIAVGRPGGPDPNAGEHLEDPVDLFDLGDAADDRAAPVEKRCAEQADRGILRRAHLDHPGQVGATLYPQVQRSAAADRDQRRVERLGDAVHHLQTEVLVPGFNAMHGALAGAENVRKLGLGQTTMLARIPDQAPDPVQVGFSHFGHSGTITHI